jgi:hypothetical protein
MICSSFILRTTSPDQALNVRMRSSICDCKVPTLPKPSRLSVTVLSGHRKFPLTMVRRTEVTGVFLGSKFLQAFIFLQVGDVQSKLEEQG